MHANMLADIEKAEVFRVLPPDRVDRLRPLLRECPFERRRVLYFEGAEASRLWIVQQGQIRLYKSSARAQITTLDVLGPGEVFGALAPLEQATYSTSAEAISDGRAWWLPRETFLKLLGGDPAVAVEILRIVSRRLIDAQERLRSFAYDPAPARLAQALLQVSTDGKATVTRRALAEAAGTTVETAIRVLRRFAHDGLVVGAVGKIDILDRDALEQIASGE
ncbi:MAG: Crp/Fnr family transcriptional regulator [Deltaproteobacteria bacterium]|nr:Crp/Fnr family transcriptional regulator [Deltaproteobacteria bacterium]